MKRVLFGLIVAISFAFPALAEEDLVQQCYRERDPHKAIEMCSKVLEQYPEKGNPRRIAMLQMAFGHLNLDNFDEVVKIATAELELYPNDSVGYFYRAAAYFGLGAWEKMAIDCDDAIGYGMDIAEIHYMRARAYLKLGNGRMALVSAFRAITQRPDVAEYYDTRAHIFEEMHRNDKAREDYKKALELKPDLVESQEGLRRLDVH